MADTPDIVGLDPRDAPDFGALMRDYRATRITNPTSGSLWPKWKGRAGGSIRYGVLASDMPAPECSLDSPPSAEFWPLVPDLDNPGRLIRTGCETETLYNRDPSLRGEKFWLVAYTTIAGRLGPIWVGCENALGGCPDGLCCDADEVGCGETTEDSDDDTTEDSDDDTTEDSDDDTTEDIGETTGTPDTTEDFDDDTTEDLDDATTEDDDDATTEDVDDTTTDDGGSSDQPGSSASTGSTGTGSSTWSNASTEDADDDTTEDAGETTGTPDTTEDRDDATTEDRDDDDTTEDADDTTGELDGPEDFDDPDPGFGGQFPQEADDFGLCCEGFSGRRTVTVTVTIDKSACVPETLPNPPLCAANGPFVGECDFTRVRLNPTLPCENGSIAFSHGAGQDDVNQGYWRGPNPVASYLGLGNGWQDTDLVIMCDLSVGGAASANNWRMYIIDNATECLNAHQFAVEPGTLVTCDAAGGPDHVAGFLTGGPVTDGCGNGCIKFEFRVG